QNRALSARKICSQIALVQLCGIALNDRGQPVLRKKYCRFFQIMADKTIISDKRYYSTMYFSCKQLVKNFRIW
ncbi:hypothetical protein AAAV51_06695, partial [Agathobaculum butyriciproducens]|uniref:hypothetical protein n=1 Tax=Agathobaculum butyriciproducens TaxID=1628085 RepID=UPI0032C0348C